MVLVCRGRNREALPLPIACGNSAIRDPITNGTDHREIPFNLAFAAPGNHLPDTP